MAKSLVREGGEERGETLGWRRSFLSLDSPLYKLQTTKAGLGEEEAWPRGIFSKKRECNDYPCHRRKPSYSWVCTDWCVWVVVSLVSILVILYLFQLWSPLRRVGSLYHIWKPFTSSFQVKRYLYIPAGFLVFRVSHLQGSSSFRNDKNLEIHFHCLIFVFLSWKAFQSSKLVLLVNILYTTIHAYACCPSNILK